MKIKEKISFLYVCDAITNKPVGFLTVDDYPTPFRFKLNALFFSFNPGENYKIITSITDLDGEVLLVRSENYLTIESSPEFTDVLGFVSRMINIDTVYVNLTKPGVTYQIKIDVSKASEPETIICTNQTFVRTA